MRLFTDGIHYHLELHQSKKRLPYLLMIHGFMGSGRAFSHLIKDLSEFCNPITIDAAGHGKTVTPEDADLFSAERQVTQIKSILDRLSFENLFVYGYSMGGRLAFQLLVHLNQYFIGAIIESAHCGIQNQHARNERRILDDKRAKQITNNFDEFLKNWMEMPLFRSESGKSSNNYSKIMREQNPDLLAKSLRRFGAGVMPPVCDKLKSLQIPTTLIAGENDKKYVKQLSSIAELNQNFTFNKVPNAGHRVHTDQPNALIKILRSTISNI